MPDDHVKGVAAVDTFWGTGADDLLDLIDGVVVATAIAVDAGRLGLSCCRFAALAPDHRPVQHMIDIGKLADAVELRASDGQRLVGAPEKPAAAMPPGGEVQPRVGGPLVRLWAGRCQPTR